MFDKEMFKEYCKQPEKLEKFVKKFEKKSLAKKSAPDVWSGKEIIGHLADCEQVYGMRFRLALAETGMYFQPFDQEMWVENLKHQNREVKDLVESFKALRDDNAELLKSIGEKDWDQFGMHPAAGKLTVHAIVKRLTDHFESHLKQVEKRAGKS